MSTPTTSRILERVIQAVATSDGAGVKLRRSLGRGQGTRVDPFLMLDEFSSDNPDDYIAGFPAHPHRGFETVTYILDGHMLHVDHLGNRGDLKSGGVQWMTAGKGIIHSEMPQQVAGRLRGFQLWINLPSYEKMKPAGYRDIQPSEIPDVTLSGGGRVKVIAGSLQADGQTIAGPIQGGATDALYLDINLPAGGVIRQSVDPDYHALIYVYEGDVEIGSASQSRSLNTHSAGILGRGNAIEVLGGKQGARFLILAGKPLNEPIAQYGPFVMNTSEEIEQAIIDYQSGKFAEPVVPA